MSPQSGDKYVTIGAVAKAHGLKGEICVDLYADSPLLFDALDKVWLRKGGGRPRAYKIQGWRLHSERVLMTLAGVADRDASELLRGSEILVRAQDLPEPEEDEVYLHDLDGLDVQLPSGESVGRFDGFLDAGGGEIWVIRSPDGREILFPAEEEFVQEVDLEAGVIRIDPPPGLLDLYAGEGAGEGGGK